jgi:hypothetical protein
MSHHARKLRKGIYNDMMERLIAPCGMNCAICSGYLAMANNVKEKGVRIPYCAGCRPRGKKCAFLKKHCHRLLSGEVKYCFQCGEYPCLRLRQLDQRYRLRFRMSMIDNLDAIKAKGIAKFLEEEDARWRCSSCGSVICCHNGICFNCGLERLQAKKKKYNWED